MTAWHRHNLDPVQTVAPERTPYDTPGRVALRDRVRAFAMDEVLPLANELDPRHEDIPPDLLARMGERITEYAVERYWRDARLTTIFEGTPEIRRRIIADGLIAATPVS